MTKESDGSLEISAAEAIRRALLHWKLVGLVVMATTTASLAYALFAEEVYEADVLVIPVVQERGASSGSLVGLARQFGALGQISGIMMGSSGRDEAIATLQSRAVTEALIRDQQLLPVLFAEDWNPEAKEWTVSNPEDVPTAWDGVKLFREQVRKVSESRKSGSIVLTVRWTDPTLAAAWANQLVRLTNEKLRQEALQRAESNLAYLREELKKTATVEVQQAIYALLEQELNQAMVARGSHEYALRVLDPAVVPEQRAWPKRKFIVALGIGTGIMLAALLIVALPRRLFPNAIRT